MVKLRHRWVEIEHITMVFQPDTLELPFFITFNVPIYLTLNYIDYMKKCNDCSPKVML